MKAAMTPDEHRTPKGFAAELYFDSETEIAIRGFREKIYAAGVDPVSGNMGDRPHVSLAVFTDIDLPCLETLCRDFAAGLAGFPVTLQAVGTFPTADNVLFLLPVPNLKLLQVHHNFHTRLKCAHQRSSSYYHPGKWVPHCTLELELPDAQFRVALKAAHDFFTPIQGVFASLGIVSFRPIEYLAEFQLQKDTK